MSTGNGLAMTHYRLTLFTVALLFSVPSAVSADIYHVKPASTGNGSGDDWANACTLAFGLANAQSGDSIWVSAGTYKPAN
jgi:hypothetical protein